MIISEFRHVNQGRYVMVVNNSQADNTSVELWFRGENLRVKRVGWWGAEIDLAGEYPGQPKQAGHDYFVCSQWFAPGQMELYRVS